jgi:hypothetical protein
VKQREPALIHWVLDHPKLAGFAAFIALAVTFTPKASILASWVSLGIATVFGIAMLWGFAAKKQWRRSAKVAYVTLFVLLILSFGMWLTDGKESMKECYNAVLLRNPEVGGDSIRFRRGVQAPPSFAYSHTPKPATASTTKQPPKPATPFNEPTPTLKSLMEHFMPNVQRIVQTPGLTFTGGVTVRYEVALLLDFPGGSKYMTIYIPASSSPQTYEIAMYTGNHASELRRDLAAVQIVGKSPGESPQASESLIDTGRVYLYHDDFLDHRQMADIEAAYTAQHLHVELRGPDYLANALGAWYGRKYGGAQAGPLRLPVHDQAAMMLSWIRQTSDETKVNEVWSSQIFSRLLDGVPSGPDVDVPLALNYLASQGKIEILETAIRSYQTWWGETFQDDIRFRIKSATATDRPKAQQPQVVINAPGGIPIVGNQGTVNSPTVNNYETVPLELTASIHVVTPSEKGLFFDSIACPVHTQVRIVPNQKISPPLTISLEFDNPVTNMAAKVEGANSGMAGGPFRNGIHAMTTVVSPGTGPNNPLIVEVCSALPVRLVAPPRVD